MEALPPLRASRTELQRLQDQLDSVRAWQEDFHVRHAIDSDLVSHAAREIRLDARRRLDAMQRTQRALLARSDLAVQASQHVLDRAPRPVSAVIAHRNAWLRTKLAAALTTDGAEIVAVVEDGADALGIVVAEQPDLLVVEDRLPSMLGIDVVHEARRFAAHTVVATQVESTPVQDMLDAGASAVFGRRVPPALIAEQLGAFLRACADAEPVGPLVLT